MLAEAWPAGQEKQSLASIEHLGDHIWSSVSSFGPQYKTQQSRSSRRPLGWLEGERVYKEQLGKLGLFGLEKWEIQLLFSAAKWGLGDGARLFLVVCSQRTRGTFCNRGKSYKAQGEKEKNVFPVKQVKPWKRLSSVAEFPFWEVLKA